MIVFTISRCLPPALCAYKDKVSNSEMNSSCTIILALLWNNDYLNPV